MNIMMLAAGEGTRLRPHTNFLPKPAIPFLNIPLFVHSLNFLREVEISKLVMNTFHLPERLKEKAKEYSFDFPVIFSDEKKTLLGSGGGLGNAWTHFQDQEHFILVNGDELIIPSRSGQLQCAIEYHKNNKNMATLLVMDHPEVGTKFGGVWTDDQNCILGFGINKVEKATRAHHNIGVMIFSREIFKYIPDGVSNILYDVLMSAIKDGKRAQAYSLSCLWFETGNSSDFILASKECLKLMSFTDQNHQFEGKYLRQMIKLFSPNSKWIFDEEKSILFDSSSLVPIKNLTGFCVIGKNVFIHKDIKIRNSVIGNNIKLSGSELIQDQIILNVS